MPGKIVVPPSNPITGAPETLPWATQGTTLAPNQSQEQTGWQPYGVGPPPDYRLENYARLSQSTLNERDNQIAIFTEYCFARVDITGVNPGANTRRITINGVDVDYTDQPGDSEDDVKAAFVALINADPALVPDVKAETSPANPVDVTGLTAGTAFTIAVSVLAGAGTISVTWPAVQPIMRTGDDYHGLDLVVGSPQADDDGNPAHLARIVWDKSKAALYAGQDTVGNWNDANRGNGSINLGGDNLTSGVSAVALGQSCVANAANTVAMGLNARARAAGAFAVNGDADGPNSTCVGGLSATLSGSTALGSGANATGVEAFAVNYGAASAANAIAIGQSQAGGTAAISIGGTAAYPSAALVGYSTAIGAGAKAQGTGSLAIGYGGTAVGGLVKATAKGAVALGYSENALVNIEATGYHSFAHGDGSQAAYMFSSATGNGALTDANGEVAHAPLMYNSEPGHHQTGTVTFVVRGAGAGKVMCTDKFDGTGSRWTIPLNTAYAIDVQCVAQVPGGLGSWVSFVATGLIFNAAGAVTAQGSILGGIVQQYATNAAGWTLTGAVVGTDYVLTAFSNGAVNDAWTATIRYTKVK